MLSSIVVDLTSLKSVEKLVARPIDTQWLPPEGSDVTLDQRTFKCHEEIYLIISDMCLDQHQTLGLEDWQNW